MFYARNKDEYAAAKRLKTYGLTAERYAELVALFNGNCHICQRAPTGRSRLHVDHDHASGRVRGLLCSQCNVSLGNFRDNPLILRAAAEYLETHTATTT